MAIETPVFYLFGINRKSQPRQLGKAELKLSHWLARIHQAGVGLGAGWSFACEKKVDRRSWIDPRL